MWKKSAAGKAKAEPQVFKPQLDTDDGIPNDKTGTLFTASLHIFCAIVGAGVLALPRSIAWLGWVAGPILICIFFFISLLTSRLLAEVYSVNGVEHARYHHAVRHILGRTGAIAVSISQLTNVLLINSAYAITGSLAVKVVATMACDEQGIADADCWNQTWKLTLLFGAAEVVLSMVPNLESAWWVSAVGVATSLTYSTIALVLSLIQSGNRLGSVGGIQADNVNKTFGILNALGAIAFAFSFSLILLEIQDTLCQPPSTVKTMKRAVEIGVGGSFVFYLTVSVAGYCAFGNEVPGMILAAFPGPRWLVQFANVMILLHVLTAWQIYAQAMFNTLESWFKAMRLKMIGRGAAAADTKGADMEAAAPQAGTGLHPRASMAGYDLDVTSMEPKRTTSPTFPVFVTTSGVPSEHIQTGPLAAAPGAAAASADPAAPAAMHPAGPAAAAAHPAPAAAESFAFVVNTAPRATISPTGEFAPAEVGGGMHVRHRPAPIHVQRVSMRTASPTGPAPRTSVAQPGSPLSRASTGSALSHRLGLARLSQASAMYQVDTGFANEAVPLNDEHYYLPFWQRFVIRTTYTAIITIIAVVMPFFNSIAGLVGALTFYPLAVFFPIHMWRRVYRPRGAFNALLWAIDFSMLLVCAAATIGAVRDIINAWSTYKIFGD